MSRKKYYHIIFTKNNQKTRYYIDINVDSKKDARIWFNKVYRKKFNKLKYRICEISEIPEYICECLLKPYEIHPVENFKCAILPILKESNND